MFVKRWETSRLMTPEGDGGGGGGAFTQADLDAAVQKATGKLAADLDKAVKTSEALAAKVEGYEADKKKAEGKTAELLEEAKAKLKEQEAQITSLTAVQQQYQAEQAGRWKTITAELGKTDKGKAALKELFAAEETPEAVAGNLALFGKLQATGMFEAPKGKGSAGEPNGGKGKADDETATPVDRLAGVFGKQMSGGN